MESEGRSKLVEFWKAVEMIKAPLEGEENDDETDPLALSLNLVIMTMFIIFIPNLSKPMKYLNPILILWKFYPIVETVPT